MTSVPSREQVLRSLFWKLLFRGRTAHEAGAHRRRKQWSLGWTLVLYGLFGLMPAVGAFMFGFSQLLFLYIVIECIRSSRKAADNPWEGADSLEWTHLPTPVPYHSFETPPTVK